MCQELKELVDYSIQYERLTGLYLQVGICGEHGGEPSSVAFFAKAGLDYVSCSPFRLVIDVAIHYTLCDYFLNGQL